jgi:hypothetical protein
MRVLDEVCESITGLRRLKSTDAVQAEGQRLLHQRPAFDLTR